MNWITAQGGLPGQELAQSILNADALHTMQLIVFLVVLAGVLQTYLHGRAVAQMSATQQNMSSTNSQFIDAMNRSTSTLQASVDETKLLRQDYTTSSLTQQRLAELTKTAIDTHDDKTEQRVKSIIEQVTTGTASLHGALQEAVTSVNETTRETVKPALEALDKLVLLSDSFDTRTEATREMLRIQHEDEMRFLQAQHEAHMRIWREHLTQAQQEILDSLKKAEEKTPDEKPIQDVALTVADPVPADDGSITNVLGVGPGSGSN